MLDVKGVSHTYNQQNKIEFPDFYLEGNEHCLLLGKSGCGKTTLLHLIGGLLSIQKGTITVGNTSLSTIKGYTLDKFRGSNMGFVFQKPHLIRSLSVIDNLMLAEKLAGKPASKVKIKSVLDELGVLEVVNKMPSELSQGQQQRVAVARALVNEPKLLIADEPTASLDDENADTVVELLMKEANLHKASLIIATHDIRVKNKIAKCIDLR